MDAKASGGDDHGSLVARTMELLLRTSNRSWNAVSGILRTWEDDNLLYGAAEGEGKSVLPRGRRTMHRFWATSMPWRLRLDHVRLGSADERYVFDSVIVHNQTWRTQRVEDGRVLVVSNAGRENVSPKASVDCLSLDFLLYPSGLAVACTFLGAELGEQDGQEVIRCHARLRPDSTDGYQAIAGLVSLRATDYIVTVDMSYGIVLGFEAYVGAHLARRLELGELSFDHRADFGMQSQD